MADVDIKLKAKNEASAEIKKVKTDLSGLASSFSGGVVGGVIGALGLNAIDSAIGQVSMLVGEIGKMAIEAGDVSELKDAFMELSAGIGQSSQAMLEASRLGSRGLVTDADLIKASNRAMMLEVIDNADEMAAVWATAEKNADALGISMTDAFDSIVSGINTQRERTLAAAGVVVDVDKALADYAATIRTTADNLDDAQRKQAILNAVMAQAPIAGAGIDSVSDSVVRYDTAVKNLRVSLGEAFGPAVIAAMGEATRMANQINQGQTEAKAFEANNSLQNVKTLMDAYRELSRVAQAAESTKTFANQTPELTNAQNAYQALILAVNEYNAKATSLGKPNIDFAVLEQGGLAFERVAQAEDAVAAGATAAGGPVAAIQAQLAALAGQADTTSAALRGVWIGAAGALGASQALAGFQGAQKELQGLRQAWYYEGRTSEEIQFKEAEYLQNTTEGINTEVAAVEALTKTVAGHGAAVNSVSREYDDLMGKVQGVVNEAMNLGDIKWPGSDGSARNGDAMNENARRMAAIANEGLINQPWLEQMKQEAPAAYADLMIRIARGMNPQQAAASIMQDFQAGLRPDMLNEGMIKERVKAMILGEGETASFVKDIAADIAAEMNISMPEALAKTQQALGMSSTGTTGQGGTGTDMTGQGSSAGTTFAAGFTTTAGGAALVGTIVAGMVTAYAQFDGAGKTAGSRWGAAFYASVQTGLAPQLIDLLVTLTTPGVLAAIKTSLGQTNPNDQPPGGLP